MEIQELNQIEYRMTVHICGSTSSPSCANFALQHMNGRGYVNEDVINTVMYYTKCAKVVDEKNDQLFCCLSVRDFEPKILFKGVHLTNSGKSV